MKGRRKDKNDKRERKGEMNKMKIKVRENSKLD